MLTISLSELIGPSFYDVHNTIKTGSIHELVAKGGRGSLKSSTISLELVQMLLKHPQCHAVVLRKYGNTLRTSVYAQVCWAIAELGLSAYFTCTVSPMQAVFKPTGQRILFFGLDDPGKLKSLKVPFGYVGMAWFEELDQFAGREEVRNVEQSLFRGGPFSFSFKSFNPPPTARNWANQYALEQRDGKLVHHSTYREAPPAWLGPRFLADADYLAHINRTAYRNEYLGEAVGSGTQVFENLRLERITDEQIQGFDRIYNGEDWGYYPDPWAFNRAYYDAARQTLYVFDEARRFRASNEETAEIIQAKGLKGNDPIIADSAEPKSIADHNKQGLNVRAARKGPGSVEYGYKWLQSRAAIVIDPVRCPHTAKEFTEYEYEQNKKTGEIMTGYPDKDNHHQDAVRYALEPVWRSDARFINVRI